MKYLTRICWILFVVIITTSCVYSQDKTKTSVPWVSDKGYWVAESNIKTPMDHTIRFYTNDHELIHTEKISGVKLNLDKKKTKMKMKNALEKTISLYTHHQSTEQISEYLVAYLK